MSPDTEVAPGRGDGDGEPADHIDERQQRHDEESRCAASFHDENSTRKAMKTNIDKTCSTIELTLVRVDLKSST